MKSIVYIREVVLTCLSIVCIIIAWKYLHCMTGYRKFTLKPAEKSHSIVCNESSICVNAVGIFYTHTRSEYWYLVYGAT